jgi:1-deoxy-D-xylulose-5-phosphate reductoisomerase
VKDLVILGSTGSIGVQALEIVEANPSLFRIVAITAAGNNPDQIIAQAKKFNVQVIGVTKNAEQIKSALPDATVIDGPLAATEVAAITCDVVLNGITGSIGLGPTLAALRVGNRVALANKESLVAGGDLVMSLAKPDQLLPVDSEHSALWQSLLGGKKSEVSKLILTASGGPFRGRSAESLSTVSVDQALNHPTWKMGPKITIDSSTLMNKGLEVIEAHELYGTSYDNIDVVVHPQSVVHSMVEFTDGSTIAQLSMPDMRLPIGYALGYPSRISTPFGRIDWTTLSRLDFEAPDRSTFRCLDLAYAAGRAGGTAPAALSAANEVIVEAFLGGRIMWADIARYVERVMERFNVTTPQSEEDVLAADAEGRQLAEEELNR